MYKVLFYESKDGKKEVADYFHSISNSNQINDKKIATKLRNQINLLEMLGPQLHMPDARYLKGQKYPLWELRPMPERVFYISWQKGKFILLSHYKKDQNKTDVKQIERAISLADDWYERFGR